MRKSDSAGRRPRHNQWEWKSQAAWSWNRAWRRFHQVWRETCAGRVRIRQPHSPSLKINTTGCETCKSDFQRIRFTRNPSTVNAAAQFHSTSATRLLWFLFQNGFLLLFLFISLFCRSWLFLFFFFELLYFGTLSFHACWVKFFSRRSRAYVFHAVVTERKWRVESCESAKRLVPYSNQSPACALLTFFFTFLSELSKFSCSSYEVGKKTWMCVSLATCSASLLFHVKDLTI